MDLIKNIADNLSGLMSRTPGLDTIKKVAARSHVGFGTVQRAKNGNGNPTISNLHDIARAFGKRVEDLLAEPSGNVTELHVKEPTPPYLADIDEAINYLRELDPQDIEIYTQELKLAALKTRKKRQEMKDRMLPTGQSDPPLKDGRTA